MMIKEWYILIDEKQEGPYSLADLRKESRLTPDTLVWKPGFEKWLPAGEVAELRKLFKDLEESEEEPAIPRIPDDDTLTLRSEPPYFYFWIVLTLIAITYAFYHLFTFSH